MLPLPTRHLRQLAAGLLAAVLLVVVAAPTSAQGMNVTVTLVPQRGQAAASFFRYDMAPGESREDRILVRNNGDQPVQLKIYAADAENTPDGGLMGPTAEEPNQGVGRWIEVSDGSPTLSPGESKTITVKMTIPPDAPPGDHFGFVFVQGADEAQAPTATEEQAGFAVRLQTRYGVILWGRVPGEHQVALEVGSPTKKIQDGRLALEVELRNTGNLFLKPRAAWVLRREEGAPLLRSDVQPLGYLLPGSAMTIRIPVVTDRPLARGRYRMNLQVEYGDYDREGANRRDDLTFDINLP